MPTPSSASGFARVASTVSPSPGQPGAVGAYPFEANSSIHGAQAAEWIQRPWMKTTGVAMVQLPNWWWWWCREWICGLQLFGQPAVDEEIGSGDVAGTVAREQQDEVGDLLGFGEPPGREAPTGRDDAGPGLLGGDARASGNGGGHTALAEPERRRDGPGADRVEAQAARAVLLRQ